MSAHQKLVCRLCIITYKSSEGISITCYTSNQKFLFFNTIFNSINPHEHISSRMHPFTTKESLETSGLKISLVTGSHLGTSILWSHDDSHIFTSSGPQILVYHAASGTIMQKLAQHDDDVISLLVNPANKQQLLSTSKDGITHVWDINDFSHLLSVNFKREIHAIAANKSSAYILFSNGDVLKFPTKIFSSQGQDKLSKYLNTKSAVFTSMDSHTLLLYAKQEKEECLITYNKKNLLIFSTHTQELHCYQKTHPITCLAVHTDKPTLAYGNIMGRVYIWHNFTSGEENITRVHWHAHAVICMCFSSDGTYLMTGGEESVLVVWQIDTLKKQFMPRIGGNIRRVASSNGDQFTALVTSDNVMKVLNSSNFDQTFISQNMKYTPWPCGMTPCPHLDSLVLHSSPPGWVQLYQPASQSRLFEIDVTGLNVVSRPFSDQLNYMLVTHIAVSHDGKWMATVESRYDRCVAFRELRLRFWRYSPEEKSYDQVTCVEGPHLAVEAISFSAQSSLPMCVSCGKEGEFRVWTVTEETKGSAGGQTCYLWQCSTTNSYANSRPTHCHFSFDASVLAVAYQTCISIWETETMELKDTLCFKSFKNFLKGMAFAGAERKHYIIGSTLTHVIIWDSANSTPVWNADVDNALLIAHPLTNFVVAVSSCDKQVRLLVFDPESEQPVWEIEDELDSEVIDACFLARGDLLSVYLLTAEQRLYGLLDKEVLNKPLTQETDSKLESLFADLLKGPVYNPESMEATQLFKKADLSIFESPCHLLPPPKTYCWSIISELLPKRDVTIHQEADEPDSVVDISEAMEVEHDQNGEVVANLDTESEDSIAAQLDYSWLDSFFKSPKFVFT